MMHGQTQIKYLIILNTNNILYLINHLPSTMSGIR